VCRCSGDDAVNIAGSAAPVFRGCKLQAKKCGVRAFCSARGTFDGCKVGECGEQGVKLMEAASLTFSRYRRMVSVSTTACSRTYQQACHCHGYSTQNSRDERLGRCHARCEMTKCAEEGAVVMDAVKLRLEDCVVQGNLGPGEQRGALPLMLDNCDRSLCCLMGGPS